MDGISTLIQPEEILVDFGSAIVTSLIMFGSGNFKRTLIMGAVYAGAHLVYDSVGKYIASGIGGIFGFNGLIQYFVEVLTVGGIFYAVEMYIYPMGLGWRDILVFVFIAVPVGDRLSLAVKTMK